MSRRAPLGLLVAVAAIAPAALHPGAVAAAAHDFG
jgi:hypothetical protein